MDPNFFIQEDRREFADGDAIYAYPITGLLCDQPEFKLGYVSLLKFNLYEWSTVEKTAILDDWLYEYMNNRPLWAYFAVPSVAPDEFNCIFFVETLVETLRIYKKGFILEPNYTVCSKYENGLKARRAGIYRTKYIEAIGGEEQRANCLKISPDEFKEIESLFACLLWLKEYLLPSISGILESFNIIHVPATRPAFIVHSLMICFEMLFGNKQESKKYKSLPNERALSLLIKTGKNNPEAEQYLSKEVYQYRNRVHHGAQVNVAELIRCRNILEYVVRIAIQEYFQLLVNIHYDSSHHEHFKILSPQLDGRVIFNKGLIS